MTPDIAKRLGILAWAFAFAPALAAGTALLACGGQAAPSPHDAGALADAAAPVEAGADGCATGTGGPTYDCEAGVPDGAPGCTPYGTHPAGPLYPVGCQATTSSTQSSFGCGPLTCTCGAIPDGTGGSTYAFTCPL